MENNIKISTFQFVSGYILLEIASFLGLGVFLSVKIASTSAYISVIIALFISLIELFMFIKIWNYEPSLPINKKILILCGKTFGTIINIIFCVFSIILTISGIYNFLAFFNSQLFNDIPIFYLGLICSFSIIYYNIKDIKVMFMTTPIIVIINILLFSTVSALLLKNFSFNNLLPIFSQGITPVIKGSYYIFLQSNIAIFYLLIIPKSILKTNKNTEKVLIVSHIIGYIFIFLLIFLTIGILGIDLSSYYSYPEYMVLKNIEIGDFLDRMENFFTVQWVFGYVFTLSMAIYYIKTYFKIRKNSIIGSSLITLSLLTITTFTFKNEVLYAHYAYNISPILKTISIVFFVIFTIIIIIKNKNNKTSNLK